MFKNETVIMYCIYDLLIQLILSENSRTVH